ncbi:MAG: uL22 family ribosomal protein [Candidatus Aenigmatarchaeota archaeon]
MKEAKAKEENARISLKDSIVLCKNLKGMKIEKAKRFLEDLINKKIDLKGKYYINAAKKILEVLKNAEANAYSKNFDLEKTFIKIAKADMGEKFIRPRSRWRLRGTEAKSTHLTIILEERK